MTPEELDLAIELLLEDNPNQEKPERRRRNRKKDLMKKARSGDTVVSEAIVIDLLGDDASVSIATVRLSYEKKALCLGKVTGWYDDIKEIADYYGKERHKLRLEKVTRYEWNTGEIVWDGESLVYLDTYCVDFRFYTESGRYIRSSGVFGRQYLVETVEIEEGYHAYTEEMQEIVKGYIGKAPGKIQRDLYDLHSLRYNPAELFKYDTKGKYGDYRRAMEEFNKYNHYSGTIRIQKGDLNGTRNRLVSAINANLSNKRGAFDGLDDAVQDYESAYYDVLNEYIW